MSPRRWAILGGVGALLVLAFAVTWFLRTHERVTRTVDVPPTGEVTRNDFFVLQLALQRAGQPARSLRSLPRDLAGIGPRDTVLLNGDLRELDPRVSARLLAWVERGGHLLLRTPPRRELDDARQAPLLQALGVRVLAGPTQCTPLHVPPAGGHVEFCRGRRFTVAGPTLHAWRAQPLSGPERDANAWRTQPRGGLLESRPAPTDGLLPVAGGLVYARIARGAGRVDVLADFDMFTNDAIDEPPHVAVARQLLPLGQGTVHVVYEGRMPSLWWQLLEQGWRALLPLALALLAWLWMRAQRLGPVLPPALAERRSLLEHVAAAGEHAWRHGHADRLHAALRDAVLARLRVRDPLTAALEGEPRVQALATRTGISAPTLRDALSLAPTRDASALRTRIAALVRLRNAL